MILHNGYCIFYTEQNWLEYNLEMFWRNLGDFVPNTEIEESVMKLFVLEVDLE